MRLLILSDLHREVWYRPQTWYEGKRDPFPAFDLDRSRPDAVILAGDIDLGAQAIEWAQATFAGLPVLYVHGNHEAYGNDLGQLQTDLAAAASASENVYFLQRRVHVMGGVRFLGCTLWTDFNLYGIDRYASAVTVASRSMSDYRRIHVAGDESRMFTPDDSVRWHAEDVAWLETNLSMPFTGKTVVVTHMAPSMRSVPEQFRDSLISAAFASNLERLVERVDLWVHGHSHTSADYWIGHARVVANPLGYPRFHDRAENPDFDPNLVVTL